MLGYSAGFSNQSEGASKASISTPWISNGFPLSRSRMPSTEKMSEEEEAGGGACAKSGITPASAPAHKAGRVFIMRRLTPPRKRSCLSVENHELAVPAMSLPGNERESPSEFSRCDSFRRIPRYPGRPSEDRSVRSPAGSACRSKGVRKRNDCRGWHARSSCRRSKDRASEKRW